MKRIGIIAILVENKQSVPKTNAILSSHAEIIIGRMGVPYKENKSMLFQLLLTEPPMKSVPFPEN